MTQHLHVVVAQNPAELVGPRARLDWLAQSLNTIQDRAVDLLVLPELFLTGYNVGEQIYKWAETRDGPFAAEITNLAKRHCLAIHYSYAERTEGGIYNASACISKDGAYLGGHRKLLLPPGFEADHFICGDSCTYFEVAGFKIATLICYDGEFPETFRKVAQDGVHLVIVPTALGAQWAVVAEKVIPASAFQNGVFICYANQAGNENGMPYHGGSCIVDPTGEELARANKNPELLHAVLDASLVAKSRARMPYLRDLKKLPWLLPPP